MRASDGKIVKAEGTARTLPVLSTGSQTSSGTIIKEAGAPPAISEARTADGGFEPSRVQAGAR